MHGLIYCFSNKESPEDICLPDEYELFELFEEYGIDYVKREKSLHEQINRLVNYLSLFGEIDVRNYIFEQIQYYGVILHPEIKNNFFKDMYETLIEFLTFEVNEKTIGDFITRYKIEGIVSKKFEYYFVDVSKDSGLTPYTIDEFIEKFVDEDKPVEIRIYEAYDYHI
jgi:hypothetical protein